MKIRFRPALRSRLLALSVSLGSFVAIVLGFIRESESTPPELSVKQSDPKFVQPQESSSTATPLPTGESVLLPSPTSSQRPSAQPSNSPTLITVAPTPSNSLKPSPQPTYSATPTATPSVEPKQSVEPTSPGLPVSPDIDPTPTTEHVVIYTCISPGGNTREPMGFPSCPSKWGYVLTQVPAK